MKSVQIAKTESVPALGQGTWFMGDQTSERASEIAALRCGVEMGLSVIDTAEMYGSGASEKVVGEAIKGLRDKIFLISKVLPYNASFDGTIKACENSLKRLGTDHLDLYLLHWRGPTPLSETIEAFENLQEQGKIRHWGVSNFDPEDMLELAEAPGGDKVATNQVLYNLTRRGIEWDLLPQSQEKGLVTMAYSPIEQARLLSIKPLQNLAADLSLTAAQLALAWVLRQSHMLAIPKAGKVEHVETNARAIEVELSGETLKELDSIFPAPRRATSLEML